MRISDIRTIAVEVNLKQTVFDANYTMATKPALLVEVHTDEGLVGLGEAAHFGGPMASTAQVIEHELKPYLIGEDPRDIERLWERMHRRAYKHARGGIVIAAISGIDIALWDLRGKMANMPVWRLLGGYRKRVPAYATGGFYAEGKGVPELVAEMESYVEAGFRAVKMKVGRNSDIELSALRASNERGVAEVSLATDIERVAAVREAIGPDIDLLIDCHNHFTVKGALEVADALRPLDLYWFEQPTPESNLANCLEVKDRCGMTTAGGEQRRFREEWTEVFEHRTMDTIMPDVTVVGGISELKKITDAASAWGIPTAPHGPFGPIALVSHLHVMAACPSTTILEYGWGEIPWRHGLMRPVEVIKNGRIRLTERPGLGFELNPDLLEAHRVELKA